MQRSHGTHLEYASNLSDSLASDNAYENKFIQKSIGEDHYTHIYFLRGPMDGGELGFTENEYNSIVRDGGMVLNIDGETSHIYFFNEISNTLEYSGVYSE
jgi:hypothetical protein